MQRPDMKRGRKGRGKEKEKKIKTAKNEAQNIHAAPEGLVNREIEDGKKKDPYFFFPKSKPTP